MLGTFCPLQPAFPISVLCAVAPYFYLPSWEDTSFRNPPTSRQYFQKPGPLPRICDSHSQIPIPDLARAAVALPRTLEDDGRTVGQLTLPGVWLVDHVPLQPWHRRDLTGLCFLLHRVSVSLSLLRFLSSVYDDQGALLPVSSSLSASLTQGSLRK